MSAIEHYKYLKSLPSLALIFIISMAIISCSSGNKTASENSDLPFNDSTTAAYELDTMQSTFSISLFPDTNQPVYVNAKFNRGTLVTDNGLPVGIFLLPSSFYTLAGNAKLKKAALDSLIQSTTTEINRFEMNDINPWENLPEVSQVVPPNSVPRPTHQVTGNMFFNDTLRIYTFPIKLQQSPQQVSISASFNVDLVTYGSRIKQMQEKKSLNNQALVNANLIFKPKTNGAQ